MMRVAILGSGSGSNAGAIIRGSQRESSAFRVVLLISTRTDAGICQVANANAVPLTILDAKDDEFTNNLIQVLDQHNVQMLALAGFMRMLSPKVIKHLRGNVINIHPALLPKHGGKGMYGSAVHQAVLDSGEEETGATVHWVTEQYDAGAIIRQHVVTISRTESVAELTEKVKHIEHQLYPQVIEELARNL